MLEDNTTTPDILGEGSRARAVLLVETGMALARPGLGS